MSLLENVKRVMEVNRKLPFAVYSSISEQKLFNVPIAKPLLVVVIRGEKEIGNQHPFICPADHFIFLSDSPAMNMRNIPKDKAYLSLLIEFDYADFDDIPVHVEEQVDYITGAITPALTACLQQFIDSSTWAPESIWPIRKKEILALLYHSEYRGLASMKGKRKISHRLYDLVQRHQFRDITVDDICEHLAMSESTLRRKLKSEGTSVQEIKDRARLGYGLHLLQTTHDSIHFIAEQCGYHSQSRFTDRFKGHFGLTPTELRKTIMTD